MKKLKLHRVRKITAISYDNNKEIKKEILVKGYINEHRNKFYILEEIINNKNIKVDRIFTKYKDALSCVGELGYFSGNIVNINTLFHDISSHK